MNLREFAKSRKVLSTLMENRTKIDTIDVIGKELTLVNFDLITPSNGKPYAVCVFKEYPDRFLFAGSVLTSLLFEIANEYGMDNIEAELDAVNGLRMKLETVKSKTKNPENGMYNSYTNVVILD